MEALQTPPAPPCGPFSDEETEVHRCKSVSRLSDRWVSWVSGKPLLPLEAPTRGGAVVRNLPAMQETQETRVPSLGREDPQEKEIANCSSILAWRTPWTEEPGGLRSIGWQAVGLRD